MSRSAAAPFAQVERLRRPMRVVRTCTGIAVAIASLAANAEAQGDGSRRQGSLSANAPACDSSADGRRPAPDSLSANAHGFDRVPCDSVASPAPHQSAASDPDSHPRADPVVAAAREYARTGVARTVEEGAFETFPYGHSQPTVTCAPLRACVIELEAGESILSKIAGDTQRWEIQLAVAGANGQTPLVVVKPHDCGLTTNLVLATTAGRIYDRSEEHTSELQSP